MTIGKIIKQKRKERGLSQRALAKELGVANMLVCNWETGRHLPNYLNCWDLADFFQCSMDELCGRTFTLTNEEKVSEKDKLLLINENKSNNFDVKSNEELFKQALNEGLANRFDKIIEIEVITYEQDRFNHFINLMEKAQKQYDRLYKRYKDSPYLFEGTTLLSDAGRELQFYKDVIAMLGQGNQKQSEWIRIEDRLPEASCECLVVTTIGGICQVNYSHRHKAFNATDEEDGRKYAMHTVTHWMPLPEAPKGD